MAFEGIAGLLVFALIAVVAIRRVFTRRGRSSLGPGAAGSVYDMLSKDKREALEIVVEERAEARDAEDAEGNLPELARERATASEPRERSAPTKRRARERVGGLRGVKPPG